MKKLSGFVCMYLMVQLCYAQNHIYHSLASEIKKNISFVAAYTYNNEPDYNIDSLCLATAKKSVKLLANTNWTNVNYKALGLRLSLTSGDRTEIKIFNFGYDCGGTRRIITHPIIQWKNTSGKTFAYNLSSNINCDFNEIYKLKSPGKNRYLLIGQESGDGNCYQSVAYVIEIRGDHLIIDQPAFADLGYINLCNMEFDFDSKTQILRGLLAHASLRSDLDALMPGVKTEKLKTLIGKGYYSEPSEFSLRFDGQKFVKIER